MKGIISAILFWLILGPLQVVDGSEFKRILTGTLRTQQSEYLPLSKGNSWTYKRTVFSDKGVFTIRPASGGPGIAMGNSNVGLGTTLETYEVKDWDSKQKAWQITVNNMSGRDGRYGGLILSDEVDKIFWGIDPSQKDALIVIEKLLLPPSVFRGERRTKFPILIDPMAEGTMLEFQYGEFMRVKSISGLGRDISVTAGKFSSLLLVIFEMKPQGITGKKPANVKKTGETKKFNWEDGWTTASFYAPGVGLVREVQKDSKGNETYLLELIKYELH